MLKITEQDPSRSAKASRAIISRFANHLGYLEIHTYTELLTAAQRSLHGSKQGIRTIRFEKEMEERQRSGWCRSTAFGPTIFSIYIPAS